MGEPTAPQLPEKAPEGLRQFFACLQDHAEFRNGAQEWLGQDIAILPGATPTTAKLDTPVGQLDLKIVGGGLVIVWTKNQLMAAQAAKIDTDALDQQIDNINRWFRKNGWKWGPATFDGDTVTLHKVPLKPGQAAQPTGTATPSADKPAPTPPPAPPKQHPPDGTTTPTENYVDTKVPEPQLPKGEVYPPKDAPGGGYTFPKAPPAGTASGTGGSSGAGGGSGPVVGAGGPGGAKAPAGLGRLAVLAFIGVIAGIVAVTLFGGPSGGTTADTSKPGSGTSGPAASTDSPGSAQTQVPGNAQTPPNAACDLANALLALGAVPDDAARLCANIVMDAAEDRIEYSGEPTKVDSMHGDLRGVRFLSANIGAEFFSKITPACAARTTVFCAETPPAPGTYAMFGIETAASLDQAASAFLELAVSLNDTTPGAGVGTTTWAGPPGDPLLGTNLAYSYRIPSVASGAAIAGPFRLAYDKDGQSPFFFQSMSAGFTVRLATSLWFVVPMSELDGVTDFQLFSFYQADDNGPQGVDLVPEPGTARFKLTDLVDPPMVFP